MRSILIALALSACACVQAPLAGGTAAREPRGDLSLGDVLALALAHNPGLSARSLGVLAREAGALQAGAWANPELSLELENVAGSGEFSNAGSAEATLSLSQLIELGGKGSRRREVSSLARDTAAMDYDAHRLNVARDATHAFIAVLAAQEQVALSSRLVDVAESTHAAVTAQVQAGGALQVEAHRARVAAETNRIDFELAEHNLTAARNRLASVWGSPQATFGRALGSLQDIETELPNTDTLLERATRTPGVARWEKEAERLRAQAGLERAGRIPDLRVDAGVRRLNDADETAFVFGVSTPLALFDRRAHASRAAGLQAEQADEFGSAESVRVRRDVAAACETLAGAHMEATRLRDTVLPEAELAAKESTEAHRAGRMALTDVLDAQRTLFRLQSRYVDALARYHSAVAEIERLTGNPVAQLEETR